MFCIYIFQCLFVRYICIGVSCFDWLIECRSLDKLMMGLEHQCQCLTMTSLSRLAACYFQHCLLLVVFFLFHCVIFYSLF